MAAGNPDPRFGIEGRNSTHCDRSIIRGSDGRFPSDAVARLIGAFSHGVRPRLPFTYRRLGIFTSVRFHVWLRGRINPNLTITQCQCYRTAGTAAHVLITQSCQIRLQKFPAPYYGPHQPPSGEHPRVGLSLWHGSDVAGANSRLCRYGLDYAFLRRLKPRPARPIQRRAREAGSGMLA